MVGENLFRGKSPRTLRWSQAPGLTPTQCSEDQPSGTTLPTLVCLVSVIVTPFFSSFEDGQA